MSRKGAFSAHVSIKSWINREEKPEKGIAGGEKLREWSRGRA